MLKKTIAKAMFFALALLCLKAQAQNDTSYYDLGRIRVKKQFTQSVTIKGEDLEKIPVTNLSDAINVWLSGKYTQVNGVVYVIDGDLINDVNAYSIFDIAEVTFIENAATALNGAVTQQDLVLIKTRKSRQGSGILVAGQLNLSNMRNAPAGLKSTYYQQYYLSAYKNTDNLHYSISADYQRDPNLGQSITPYSLTNYNNITDHLKLFGFLNAQLNNSNSIGISVNYAPQTDDLTQNMLLFAPTSYSTINGDYHSTPDLLNAHLALTSNIGQQLTNQLSLNYNNLAIGDRSSSTSSTTGISYVAQNSQNRSSTFRQILLRDDLRYHLTYGDWHVDPALNFNLRYWDYHETLTAAFDSLSTKVTYHTQNGQTIKSYLLTPSVNVDYKSFLSFQGGFIVNLGNDADAQKMSPYATASIDVLRLTEIPASYSWKIYASYANFKSFNDPVSTAAIYNIATKAPQFIYPMINIVYPLYGGTFTNWQTGSEVSFLNSRLTVGYTYAKRQFSTSETYVTTISGSILYSTTIYSLVNGDTHRISISANIFDDNRVKWLTTLNATHITNNYVYNNGVPSYVKMSPTTSGWSGGWVNRLQFGRLSTGANMLYLVGEPNVFATSYSAKINSFVLQDAYVSYQIKTARFKSLEVYANIHDAWQNSTSDITDNRKFYGGGFKLGL